MRIAGVQLLPPAEPLQPMLARSARGCKNAAQRLSRSAGADTLVQMCANISLDKALCMLVAKSVSSAASAPSHW